MTIWKPDLSQRSGPRYLAIVDLLADDVASGRPVEMKEEISAASQTQGQMVVAGRAASNPDLQISRGAITPRHQSIGNAVLAEFLFRRRAR